MEFVKLPTQMRPAAGKRHRSTGPIGLRKLAIGGIAVALKNAAPACQMPFEALRAAAILKAVDDDRRTGAAIGTVVSQIGP
jgi:hypothetical protein